MNKALRHISLLTIITLLHWCTGNIYGQNNLLKNGDTRTTWGKYGDVWDIGDGKNNSVETITVDLSFLGDNGVINMIGVIRIYSGKTLRITSSKNVTIKNTGIAPAGEMIGSYSVSTGRSRLFTVKSRGKLIIEGTNGATITLDGGADYTWNNYKLIPGANSRTLSEAIAVEGALELKNVCITDIRPEENYNEKSDANIHNGGGIHIANDGVNPLGTTVLDNCTIKECYSELGSAIMIDSKAGGEKNMTINSPESCKITISNTTVSHCISGGGTVDNSGGAIRTYGSSVSHLYLKNVTMEYNYAKRLKDYRGRLEDVGNGGALFWNAHGRTDMESVCTIDGCTFRYNKSDDYGGAIKSQASIKFDGDATTIVQNEAPYGGGMYIEGYQGGVNVGAASTINTELNGKLIVKENKAPKTIEGTAGRGGGILFLYGSDMDLYPESILNVSLIGATIQNNTSVGDGGGIYFLNETLPEKKYKININLNYGSLSGNVAENNGGGIYVLNESVNSTKIGENELAIYDNTANGAGGGVYIENGSMTMAYGSISTKGQKAYSSIGNGGGIYVNGGDFTMMQGTISGNISKDGNGGGVYLKGGNVTISNGDITGNIASKGNGGGISMEDGTFTISNGSISGNNSTGYGGGLYVYSTETGKTASFSGGTINGNASTYGGGVCVDGSISLSISGVAITGNTALNGGGVALLNNAGMSFGAGAIRFNYAEHGNASTSFTTAYNQRITDVSGIGGGVFLDSGTSLKFTDNSKLGFYGNLASKAADDIFANGSGTTVELPDVSSMQLSEFGAAGTLNWVEDYIPSDTGYSYGTNKKNPSDQILRYRDAVANLKATPKVVSADFESIKGKYICLALGYRVVYAKITKIGLKKGESSIFKIYGADNNSSGTSANPFATILLTGTSDDGTAAVSKEFAITTGKWIAEETAWSWAYTSDASNDGKKEFTVIDASSDQNVVTFTNTQKSGLEKIDYHETIKVNTLGIFD